MKRSISEITAIFLAAVTLLASARVLAELPKNEVKLEPASLFTLRDGLPNVAEKLKAGSEVNIVFLGGSITVGGATPKGYVTYIGHWLKEQYANAKINIINSGISGTGSDFGNQRYDRDVLSKKPDLVLIEFCVNDGDNDCTEFMEKMVHKTWIKNPKTDLLIFYTLEKHHLDYYKAGNLPPSASAHERVAAFYGIPSLGTAFNVTTKIHSGEITWERFSRDGCHPTQDGYGFFNEVFAQALPKLLKAAPAQAHALGKSITPNLQVYRPPFVAQPLTFKGDFVTAQGEKALKVYPLPIPIKNWVGEPVFREADGKPLWRLSWLSKEFGGKCDPTVGADKTKWETNPMVWFEGNGSFTGPHGTALFRRHFENSMIGISGKEIGIIRFLAPETGRYAVSVKSGPWSAHKGDDKTMSFSILKFSWNGGLGQSLAFQKEIKRESKGLSIDIESKMVAGEELAFVPDIDHMGADWTAFRIVIGYLGD